MSAIADQPKLAADIAIAADAAISLEEKRQAAIRTIEQLEALPLVDARARKRFSNARYQIECAENHQNGRAA